MNKKDYTNLFTHISNDMNLIKISKINIYNTKNSLNTEYHELFTRGNSKIYKLFKDYNLGSDLELYLRLDMLTYLPFEKIGYDYLNNKLEKENSSVIEFKYNRIIKIFNDANEEVNNDLKDNIKYFLNNYYKDTIKINIIGFSLIILRLFHHYITMMNFKSFKGGTLEIQRKISIIIDIIINEINEKELKEININDYLEGFNYSTPLNENMSNYLENCLKIEI